MSYVQEPINPITITLQRQSEEIEEQRESIEEQRERIEELEEEHWLAISRTPHEELLKWHDEKLKTEVRILEAVH